MIAYRFLSSEEADIACQDPAYEILPLPFWYWCADPFPWEWRGKHYIFTEAYHYLKQKGIIAYYCLEDSEQSLHPCLEEAFHLSYPNVFEYGGEVFMIPESCESRQLRLYRATDFPDRWVLDTVLLSDIKLVDSSLLIDKHELLLETCSDSGNLFYTLDMKNRKLIEHPVAPTGWCNKRPGGNFFSIKGEWFHALQECSRTYGEYMHLARVEAWGQGYFHEKILRELHVADCAIPHPERYLYTHTLNRCKRLEVIDLFCTRRHWAALLVKIYTRLFKRAYRSRP